FWDLASGKLLRTVEAADGVSSAAFSPNGLTLLTTTTGIHTVQLWEVASGKLLRTINGQKFVATQAAYSPDGRSAISSIQTINPPNFVDDEMMTWDLPSGRLLRTFTTKGMIVGEGASHVAVSPDGRTALTGSRDENVKLWELATGRLLRTYGGHQDKAGTA